MFPFAVSIAGQLHLWQVAIILQHCRIRPGC